MNSTVSNDDVYTPGFFDEIRASSENSAAVVTPLVLEWTRPQSVVDVGCGSGYWLKAFEAAGVKEVLGIDGDYVAPSSRLIDGERFLARDLSEPLEIGRRFDLAVSLEVAEHLPNASSREFVRSLCRLAPAVLFSAAVPGQGGANHINEQWPDFWATLFAAEGFDCFDVLRAKVWSDSRVAPWYCQNLLLFAQRRTDVHERISRIAPSVARPLSLVHPKLFEVAVQRAAELQRFAAPPSIGQAFKAFCRAVVRRRSSAGK